MKSRKRAAGILMPIASLPGEYGIGTLGQASYDFVDMLALAGQTYWQILPLGPTGYGDSPYQSFSTFAGNPYLIDPQMLIEDGLLTKAECDAFDFGASRVITDYGRIYEGRFKLLRKAYGRAGDILKSKKYRAFVKANESWLDDYALYTAVKESFEGKSFILWDEDIRKRKSSALKEYKKRYADDIEFVKFMQFMFYEQWSRLKAYANEKGIRIVGDIPIYVAFDSADTWSCPEMFLFDDEGYPTVVAGVPPDCFSTTGQLWGNPIYNWDYHKNTGYKWWIERVAHCFEIYDVVRIDHFRAFDTYYTIPYGRKDAVVGKWNKGPGMQLFKAIEASLGEVDLIAEDLGDLFDSVRKLVKRTGYPGMKILEFAFNAGQDSEYLPHNYDRNCVVYTGTHDNATVVGWYQTLKKADRKMVRDYLNIKEDDAKTVCDGLIRLAMMSSADTCIIPMQDWLGLDNRARINIPSTLGGNWQWRMKEGAFTKTLARRIAQITKIYAR